MGTPSTRTTRGLVALPTAAAGAAMLAVMALAEGGASVSTSPIVPFGVQEFGNSQTTGADSYSSDYWRLKLTTGDRVAIDWQQAPPANLELDLWPANTNDFNVGSTRPMIDQVANDNNRNEMSFDADRSGLWPIAFTDIHWLCLALCPKAPGAFQFVVHVKHVVLVSLPAVARLRPRSVVKVVVRDPDGHGITDPRLEVRLWAGWHGHRYMIGTGSARGGVVRVTRLRLPSPLRGRVVTLTAFATGAQYVPARSISRESRVA